jgi:hypothetical protein
VLTAADLSFLATTFAPLGPEVGFVGLSTDPTFLSDGTLICRPIELSVRVFRRNGRPAGVDSRTFERTFFERCDVPRFVWDGPPWGQLVEEDEVYVRGQAGALGSDASSAGWAARAKPSGRGSLHAGEAPANEVDEVEERAGRRWAGATRQARLPSHEPGIRSTSIPHALSAHPPLPKRGRRVLWSRARDRFAESFCSTITITATCGD